jgi:hypothetical protein
MGTESRESRTLSLNFQYLMHENLARDNHFQSKRLQLCKVCRYMTVTALITHVFGSDIRDIIISIYIMIIYCRLVTESQRKSTPIN